MKQFFLALLLLIPGFESAEANPVDLCKSFAGDFSLDCRGDIPKIEELRRFRTSAQDCAAFSFILEGKDTATGRVFFPSSTLGQGAVATEEAVFNDGSLKVIVVRTAAWSEDYTNFEMITSTKALDPNGAILSAKKIIMNLSRRADTKLSLAILNNDTAHVLGSPFQSAVCGMGPR